jgi:hypothetical protein
MSDAFFSDDLEKGHDFEIDFFFSLLNVRGQKDRIRVAAVHCGEDGRKLVEGTIGGEEDDLKYEDEFLSFFFFLKKKD